MILTVRVGYTQVTTRVLIPLCLTFAAIPALAQGVGSLAIGSGTSVVVMRSAKLLVAAVDSREVYRLYKDGSSAVQARTMCKLARVGPHFVIVAGLAHGHRDAATAVTPDAVTPDFDALQAAGQALQQGDSPSQLADRTRAAIPGLLLPVLGAVRDADPADFAARFEGQAALQLTFLGKDKGEPAVIIVEFGVRTAVGGALELVPRTTRCPGDCAGTASAWFMGTHDNIDRYLRGNTGFIGHPDEGRAEALIRLEYDARPDLVGGPVSILRIEKSGAMLVREGACGVE